MGGRLLGRWAATSIGAENAALCRMRLLGRRQGKASDDQDDVLTPSQVFSYIYLPNWQNSSLVPAPCRLASSKSAKSASVSGQRDNAPRLAEVAQGHRSAQMRACVI